MRGRLIFLSSIWFKKTNGHENSNVHNFLPDLQNNTSTFIISMYKRSKSWEPFGTCYLTRQSQCSPNWKEVVWITCAFSRFVVVLKISWGPVLVKILGKRSRGHWVKETKKQLPQIESCLSCTELKYYPGNQSHSIYISPAVCYLYLWKNKTWTFGPDQGFDFRICFESL